MNWTQFPFCWFRQRNCVCTKITLLNMRDFCCCKFWSIPVYLISNLFHCKYILVNDQVFLLCALHTSELCNGEPPPNFGCVIYEQPLNNKILFEDINL